MPKTPTNYSRTIIYKICCKDLLVTDIYIGHTTEFIKRKYNHKVICNYPNNKKYNQKIYKTIRDNGNWDNWEMIEIEKYPCNDGNEATARERYWYETLNANMNSNVPNRSQKEYQQTNKEQIQEYIKEYRETNKEQIQEYHKEYREKTKEQTTCECGGHYSYNNRLRHLKTPKHINFINSL